MKKPFLTNLFLIFGILCCSVFGSTILANNFFIKDTFKKEGLEIKYTGVIKFNASSASNYTSDARFELYLASFFIEEVTYKGIKYRAHELFGYSFPEEVLSKIKIKALVRFRNAEITLVSNVSSFDKTLYKLTENQRRTILKEASDPKEEFNRGVDFRLKLIETYIIDFPINKKIISLIIDSIKSNKAQKTELEKEKEYIRLLTEGNIFLGKNNFKQSLISYSYAKKYAINSDYIDGKIDIVESYLAKNGTNKYRWLPKENESAVSISKSDRVNLETDFISTSNKKKFLELETEAKSLLFKNQYNKAIDKFTEAKKYTTNKTAIDKKIAVVEKFKRRALGKPVSEIPKRSVKKDQKNEVKPIVEKKKTIVSKNKVITKKITPKKETKNNALVSSNKLAKKKTTNNNYSFVKSTVISNEAKIETSKKVKEVTKKTTVQKQSIPKTKKTEIVLTNSLKEKAEILKTEFRAGEYRKGFVKYKRDEQAVLDAFNNVLIPFGKYEIVRYRAGFANIKMKDSVALKTIECTGKNDEYSWSARIYQNPWIETVVDKNGNFIEELNKRVEIYVVDNVSLLPWDEVPKRIKKAYKDPNQYTGTDFISAFNLWEHENKNKPEVVARRKEIKVFKEASKKEAYKGADHCKEKVAKSIEEVYTYYKNLGYEIVIKY